MYNLLITSRESAWEFSTYYLHNRSRFYSRIPNMQNLDDPSVIAKLCTFPALFMYEQQCSAPGWVGKLTKVLPDDQGIRIDFELDRSRQITWDVLIRFIDFLGIHNSSELNHSHWAVKNVDLEAVISKINDIHNSVRGNNNIVGNNNTVGNNNIIGNSSSIGTRNAIENADERRADNAATNGKFLLTTASTRMLLNKILIDDSDIDAFCMDYFREVFDRFTDGMNRIAKYNILLQRASTAQIVQCLRKYDPNRFLESAHLLRDNNSHD